MGLLGPSGSAPVVNLYVGADSAPQAVSRKPKGKNRLKKLLLAGGIGFLGFEALPEDKQDRVLETMGDVRDKVGDVSGGLLEDGKEFISSFTGDFEQPDTIITVQKGDNFLALASDHYGETVRESDLDKLIPLCEGVTDPHKIHPGDQITFPPREVFLAAK